MAESGNNIGSEHLLAIQADLAVMKVDISDMKQRMGALEQRHSLRSHHKNIARVECACALCGPRHLHEA